MDQKQRNSVTIRELIRQRDMIMDLYMDGYIQSSRRAGRRLRKIDEELRKMYKKESVLGGTHETITITANKYCRYSERSLRADLPSG